MVERHFRTRVPLVRKRKCIRRDTHIHTERKRERGRWGSEFGSGRGEVEVQGWFESGVLNERRWCARVVEGGLGTVDILYIYIYICIVRSYSTPRRIPPSTGEGDPYLRMLHRNADIRENPRCLIEIR